MTTDERLTSLLSEASDLESEASSPSEDEGTDSEPPEGTDVENPPSSDDEPSEEELPKHSDRALQAALEVAREEGKSTALQQRLDSEKANRDHLTSLVKDSDANMAPVLRRVAQKMKETISDLEDSDIEPTIQVVREIRDSIEAAAFHVVGQEYLETINSILKDDSTIKSFWDSLGPDPNISDVVPALVDNLALSSKAVKSADPEDLIKTNSKLKAYLESEKDKARAAGRKIGQKDPRPEGSSEGRPVSQNGDWPRDDSGKINVEAALAKLAGG